MARREEEAGAIQVSVDGDQAKNDKNTDKNAPQGERADSDDPKTTGASDFNEQYDGAWKEY
jgi:hypothetical protein